MSRPAAGSPATSVKVAPGDSVDGRSLRILMLRSAFNAPVVEGLAAGALEALRGASVERIEVVQVPGAFELPLVAREAARSGAFDGIVALGAVIRGETDHYDHIAREAASGLARVALDTGVPTSFGVLTVRDERHALSRAEPGPDNKGAEAARAVLSTLAALRQVRDLSRAEDGDAGTRRRP